VIPISGSSAAVSAAHFTLAHTEDGESLFDLLVGRFYARQYRLNEAVRYGRGATEDVKGFSDLHVRDAFVDLVRLPTSKSGVVGGASRVTRSALWGELRAPQTGLHVSEFLPKTSRDDLNCLVEYITAAVCS